MAVEMRVQQLELDHLGIVAGVPGGRAGGRSGCAGRTTPAAGECKDGYRGDNPERSSSRSGYVASDISSDENVARTPARTNAAAGRGEQIDWIG